MTRTSGSTSDVNTIQATPEKHRGNSDTSGKSVPVTSGLLRSTVTPTQQVVRNTYHAETSEPQVFTETAAIKGPSLMLTPTHPQDQKDITESIKEIPQEHSHLH